MLPAAGVYIYNTLLVISTLDGCFKNSSRVPSLADVGRLCGIFLFRDVKQMLLKLIELRSSDWGRVQAAAAASNATPDNDPNYFMVSRIPRIPFL